MTPPAQPRRYHVRCYAPDQEVSPGRRVEAVLNMTPGPGAARARSRLNRLLTSLATADLLFAGDIDRYRLTVTDVETGETFHWHRH